MERYTDDGQGTTLEGIGGGGGNGGVAGGRRGGREEAVSAANSKHWFTTSFLQPLPYLVTP